MRKGVALLRIGVTTLRVSGSLARTHGDTSWNDRFADVGILNMVAGAEVESGEPLMGPVDDTGRVVTRQLIVQSY